MDHPVDTTRKIPRQRRAEATAEALIAAAAQVLEREGEARFTTSAVAERAGVSIGTLYQYFRNREDLLFAIARRELREALHSVARTLTAERPGQRARPVVAAILGGFRRSPRPRRAALTLLFRLWSRGELLEDVKAFTQSLARQLAGELNLTEEQAFVLTRAVLGVANSALTEQTALDPQKVEDELAALIVRYLAPLPRR